MNERLVRKMNLIRAKHLQRRVRMDDDGKWVTTEGGNHVHINGEGVPDKGNPHVLEAMGEELKSSSKAKPQPIGRKVTHSKSFFRTAAGKDVDVFSTPVKFSEKAEISPKYADRVRALQSARKNNKVEFASLYDADGNLLTVEKGGAARTRIPVWALLDAEILTHTHPRPANNAVIGGTFSIADLRTFLNDRYPNMRVFRAAAQEGVYTIKKGENFDGAKFLSAVKSKYDELDGKFDPEFKKPNDRIGQAAEKLWDEKISYAEYEKIYNEASAQHDAIFNRYLIAQHNALLDMQKDYNYEYGLEEW